MNYSNKSQKYLLDRSAKLYEKLGNALRDDDDIEMLNDYTEVERELALREGK